MNDNKNTESFLIDAWNDYLQMHSQETGEDTDYLKASKIEDVDFNLEGFAERYEYEIYLYSQNI